MKQYRFFFHYNKPASLQSGINKMSVHFRGVCYIINEVVCNVPCKSKVNKRQPRVVMQGWSKNVLIDQEQSIAYIN